MGNKIRTLEVNTFQEALDIAYGYVNDFSFVASYTHDRKNKEIEVYFEDDCTFKIKYKNTFGSY